MAEENDHTKQIEELAQKSKVIGDTCYTAFEKNNKLEYAKVALIGFRNSLYAHSLLIKKQKL
jgi:hypothetical protein